MVRMFPSSMLTASFASHTRTSFHTYFTLLFVSLILSVFPTSQRISFMTQCTNKFSRTGPQGATWCMESREKQGTQSKAASVMPPKCGFPTYFFPSSLPKFYSYKWKKPRKKRLFKITHKNLSPLSRPFSTMGNYFKIILITLISSLRGKNK